MAAAKVPLPLKICLIGSVLILAYCARWIGPFVIVINDPTTAPQLVRAKAEAAPILVALNKYHEANGFYPIRLGRLGRYLPRNTSFQGYIYSVQLGVDRVLKSPACTERAKAFYGFIMRSSAALARDVDAFEQDCALGYRQFQLQTPDFATGNNVYIERWATYNSLGDTWRVGWCRPDVENEYAHAPLVWNGICRQVAESIPPAALRPQ